jgi:hypothetical protein
MNLNDLMTSETNIQEPTYSWWLDFNVISAVEEEKKSAKNVAREKLTQHLKDRSDLRKAIRSWEKSSWNKDVDNKTVIHQLWQTLLLMLWFLLGKTQHICKKDIERMSETLSL